jgi:sulfite exporter TauE/SafE
MAYNAGRIASYTIAGLAVGALGQGALALRPGPAAQQIALAAAGASMLLIALSLAGLTSVTRRLETAGTVIWRRLQPLSRHFLPADTFPKALGLGAVWGWLPCGLVYGALVTATATGSALEGGIVMLSFGAGTLPNVLALGIVAGKLQRLARKRPARFAVAGIVATAGLMALALSLHHYSPVDALCRLIDASPPAFSSR